LSFSVGYTSFVTLSAPKDPHAAHASSTGRLLQLAAGNWLLATGCWQLATDKVN
jgi:hypothetical protein